MKTALIIIMLFAFTLPCAAELTKEDMRQIIRAEIEPLKIDITEIKSDIKSLEGRMASFEGRMTPLESKMAMIESKMAMIEGKMATKDDIIALSERMNTLYSVLVSILVAIIVAILGIFLAPSLRKWFQERKQIGEATPRIGEKELTRIKDELKDELKGEFEELKKIIMAKVQ